MKNKLRHGELILTPVEKIEGKELNHLILAEGKTTGHKHEIVEGKAKLYNAGFCLFLVVISKEAKLIHPDHNTIMLKKGNYKIETQREYEPSPEKYRRVVD